MTPARPASLKVRALQWLAQREHSRTELRLRLLRLLGRQPEEGTDGEEPQLPPDAEVDAVLDWLEQRGYLSDARFAESRIHARQSRYGNQRIRQELRQHGIVLDDATQAALADSEFSRALAQWQRRYDAPAADPAARLRQMRFLVGRGFSMPVVQRVLKQAGRPDDADVGLDD